MINVLINSLLVSLIFSVSCRNVKNDVRLEKSATDYSKDSLNVVKSKPFQIEQQQDSIEYLYTNSFKDKLSGNTYDVISNTYGIIRELKLNYDTFGTIDIPNFRYDTLALDYYPSDKPLRVSLNIKNKSIKTFLINYTEITESKLIKNGENYYFNIYSDQSVGDSITLIDDDYSVKEAYFMDYKNRTYSKREIREEKKVVDFAGTSDYWNDGSGSPKKIMNTNDFDISLNKEKETVFDVTFKTYGEIDGIYFRYKELYEGILKEKITEDLRTIKVNITNKKEGIKYAFKIFPVEDNFYPQEYKLVNNKNKTTTFVMKHKYPFNTETVYSDSIIFYKNTNKIKAVYRVYNDGDFVKMKVNNRNDVNEICGYFGSYDSEDCID